MSGGVHDEDYYRQQADMMTDAEQLAFEARHAETQAALRAEEEQLVEDLRASIQREDANLAARLRMADALERIAAALEGRQP